MDTLKNKQYNDYDYICRYTSVPFYYDTVANRYIYGIGTQMEQNISYVAHKVKDTDTLEYLALKYYNNPTLYWIIAYFNNILDSFEPLIKHHKVVNIPNLTSITFGNER